jgi:hypothetical protein
VHHSQIEQNGGDWWLDGVRGRAMYRGYQMNVRYAEAFEVVKEIEVHFGNGRRESTRAARRRDDGRREEKRKGAEPDGAVARRPPEDGDDWHALGRFPER